MWANPPLEAACLAFWLLAPSCDKFELILMKGLNCLGECSMRCGDGPNTEQQPEAGMDS